MTDNNDKALSNNIKCNQGLEHLNRRMTDFQKKNNDEEFKLDELEQYDRRQNLKFAQVPYQEEENVTQIVLDLASKLAVKLDNENISIAHRLPKKINVLHHISMVVKNQCTLLLWQDLSAGIKEINYTKIASRQKALIIFRLMV